MKTKMKQMFVILFLAIPQIIVAKEFKEIPVNTNSGKVTAGCKEATARAILDINNVRTLLYNAGDMWWDRGSQTALYEVPKTTDPFSPKKNSLFAGGIWLGGKDQLGGGGNLMLTSVTYRLGGQYSYWPGPIEQNKMAIDEAECLRWDRMFTVHKANVDKLKNLTSLPTSVDTNLISTQLYNWPGNGNPFISLFNNGMSGVNINRPLAPFVDVNGDCIYNPHHGDYPDIRGDQAIWWVMNDVGGVKNPVSNPIGLEMSVMAFAFASADDLNNMTFYKQKIVNKGASPVFQTYVGQYADPDLGKYDDDYVQCDVARGLGICYNGDDEDEGTNGYGLNPPSIGIDFFSGPLADANDGIDNNRNGTVDEIGEKIIMSNFMYYNNNGNNVNGEPNTANDFYNYLRSIWKNNTPVKYDVKDGTGDGLDCKFMFPGTTDPFGYGVGGTPTNPKPQPIWTEKSAGNTPSDRRFLISAGPFTMESGEVTDVTIGVVWARATSGGATGSFGLLLKADDYAQNLFDNDFELPNGPNAPNLVLSEHDQEVIINIEPTQFLSVIGPKIPIVSTGNTCSNETLYKKNEQSVATDSYVEFYNNKFYNFQGFLLYQIKNELTPTDYSDQNNVRLIAQCDVKDGIKFLVNSTTDPETGVLMNTIKVNGEDTGLKYSFKITKDAFATGNDRLVNYKDYYFLVKAYAANLDEVSPTAEKQQYLESRLNIKTYKATPHKTKMEFVGFDEGVIWGQSIAVTKLAGNGGNGGNILKLTSETKDEIISKNKVAELKYELENSPFEIKVVAIKDLITSDFNIRLRSVIEIDNTSNKKLFAKGDTIVVVSLPIMDGTTANNDPDKQRNYASGIKQTEGIAVVEEMKKSFDGNKTTYFVNILNQKEGGRFTLLYDSLNKVVETNGDISYTFKKHLEMPLPVTKKGDLDTMVCIYYKQNDSFILTDLDNKKEFRSHFNLSKGEECFIPEFGITIKSKNVNNAGYKLYNNDNNGFLDISVTYQEPAKEWINTNTGIEKWIDEVASAKYDPKNKYLLMANKGWAPYFYTSNFNSNGAAYASSKDVNAYLPNKDGQLNRLKNVDIVFTDDKTKWTEVVVLQYDQQGTSAHPSHKLNKSLLPSIGKDMLPTGQLSSYKSDSISRGKSWFPGYAVDIDKGVRLNMMFSESKNRDIQNGNNLIWNPSSFDSLLNFVYILNSEYDNCKKVEYLFDSIRYLSLPVSQHQVRMTNAFVSIDIMYVGNILLKPKTKNVVPAKNQTDALVGIRVDREFENNETEQPLYFFSTKGYEPKKKQMSLAKEALDLIRVVPNPYYAYSEYEKNQLQNLVKITNLPQKCTISIFTVNGTLVRTLTKDNVLTYQEWNLQNQESIPISSGTYIMHINAPEIGEKVVKWMGVNRVIDLETF